MAHHFRHGQPRFAVKRGALLLAALALACMPAVAAAQTSDSPGAAIYYACATCHGELGEADEARMTPAIAVLPAWYTAAQLRAYRDGWRGAESDDFTSRKMTLFAQVLASDEALEAVAAYAASLGGAVRDTGKNEHEQSTEPSVDAATARHFEGCASCHGLKGQGIEELGAPPIAGQPDWYVKRQMNAFATGTRGSHADDRFGGQMRIAPAPSDSDQLAALIRYMAGLPRP